MRGTPEEWARVAVNAYHDWKADRIIGETNNGGEMVETVIRMVDKNVALQGRPRQPGQDHPRRADQRPVRAGPLPPRRLLPGSRRPDVRLRPKTAKYSPDRMDALVWGFTELMTEELAGAGWMQFFEQQAAEAAKANGKTTCS